MSGISEEITARLFALQDEGFSAGMSMTVT